MHLLGQQILYWKPEAVSMRDSPALEADRLYGLVGLSARRYGPGLHIFLFHQTPRILHSGNPVRVSSKGGERMHQPQKKIPERTPTYWFSRCQPGILDCTTWGAQVLGLWFLGEEVRYKHCDPLSLPSFRRESACVGLTLFLLHVGSLARTLFPSNVGSMLSSPSCHHLPQSFLCSSSTLGCLQARQFPLHLMVSE